MTEQGRAPWHVVSGSDDQALVDRLPPGADSAFGELFERHADAVRRLALGLAADRSEADDVTAETFFRVLQAVKRGAGPKENPRAYLLTVARRVCWEWHGSRRDVPVSDDELTYRAGFSADTLGRAPEHALITTAFSSLPERWRTVLWHTEVEGEQPAVVAPSFGLSANATAALARRARQGLRAAYLQAHLAVNRTDGGCKPVTEKLGGYTAGSVSGTEARRIKRHLRACPDCESRHSELRDVCWTLRANAGIIVLLVPASAIAFGSGSGAGGAAGASTAAASGAAAGSAGSGQGMLVAAKALVFGSKLKVGLALASTAAAGVFGASVGPVFTDSDSSMPMGLPGHSGSDLPVVEVPSPLPAPKQPRADTQKDERDPASFDARRGEAPSDKPVRGLPKQRQETGRAGAPARPVSSRPKQDDSQPTSPPPAGQSHRTAEADGPAGDGNSAKPAGSEPDSSLPADTEPGTPVDSGARSDLADDADSGAADMGEAGTQPATRTPETQRSGGSRSDVGSGGAGNAEQTRGTTSRRTGTPSQRTSTTKSTDQQRERVTGVVLVRAVVVQPSTDCGCGEAGAGRAGTADTEKSEKSEADASPGVDDYDGDNDTVETVEGRSADTDSAQSLTVNDGLERD